MLEDAIVDVLLVDWADDPLTWLIRLSDEAGVLESLEPAEAAGPAVRPGVISNPQALVPVEQCLDQNAERTMTELPRFGGQVGWVIRSPWRRPSGSHRRRDSAS